MPYIISKACTKCTACLRECPTGSIIEGKSQYYIDADTCAEHTACVTVCPVDAISKRPDIATRSSGLDMSSEEEL